MAVPTLKLDLAPPSTFWRLNHALAGWVALVAGGLVLAGAGGWTLHVYRQAVLAGRNEVVARAQSRRVDAETQKVLDELRSVDVTKELPRWRLAERIFTERSLPWSRLTAELERSMVPDVRVRSLQRTRGSDMKVQIKVKGEAKSRQAEAFLVESLQKNPFFEQVLLEREAERQGGGVDFEYTLAANSVPPAYAPLPKFGPQPKAEAKPEAKAAAPKAAPRPAPAAPQPRPQAQPAAPAVPPPPPVNVRPGDMQTRPMPRPTRVRPRPGSGGEE